MGINWMLLFEAYQYTTISLATLSYYLAPVLVTALCPLLFHERMTRMQLICFLMSTLGVALIIGSGGVQGGGSDVRGILFGVSAAVFYAAVILLNKYITGVPALERTFVQFLAAILVLTPYVALTSGFHPGVMSTTGWVNLLIVGLVHTGLTYCMYFSAIRARRRAVPRLRHRKRAHAQERTSIKAEKSPTGPRTCADRWGFRAVTSGSRRVIAFVRTQIGRNVHNQFSPHVCTAPCHRLCCGQHAFSSSFPMRFRPLPKQGLTSRSCFYHTTTARTCKGADAKNTPPTGGVFCCQAIRSS